MTQYNTSMRNASKYAKQVIQIKGNHYLDGVDGFVLDHSAFIPDIRNWTLLEGFREVTSESSAEMLKRVSQQWMRSSCRSGCPSAFVLTSDQYGFLSVRYGNMHSNGILYSNLPDCHVNHQNTWNADGYRYSGIILGTLASENIADTFAAAGIDNAYLSCIVIPVADSVAHDILTDNRRLSAKLEPYKSFQRVYGNSTRRTVDVPVEEVIEALSVLKDDSAFLQSRLTTGLVCTAIRFGTYDQSDYYRLADLIQSGLAVNEAYPGYEPVRCFSISGNFTNWRTCLAIPHVAIAGLENAYAVSFQGITDAASFCTAPVHSYKGYYVDCSSVSDAAHDLFPVVHEITQDGIAVGTALNSIGNMVLPLSGFLCHTAVFGASNTGKTTIVKNTLHHLWNDYHIPFVVLEAAKKEYNALLSVIPELRIFTPGVDGTPLLMNPLQPEDGVLIENHVSAVVMAISAATGAEHPIPEAFSGLLKRTYQRFGWEYSMMAYSDHTRPFPTFSDVLEDVDAYINTSAQYGPEVRQNLTAALKLRCETFSSGALGMLFSPSTGLTAKDFFEVPTVVELADLSEESTAFMMNILLFKFQTYLERVPESGNLNRLIVVEEAHNVFRKTLSEESSLAKSNQAFDKMFAEIRASGTGLVLSDQRPSIMPDSVLANTALKLCLGMDSEEDRSAIGDAMNLSDIQRRELHSFKPGECLVTVRGHRGVFHVQADKISQGATLSAACIVCSNRFRCRKAAVLQLIADLPKDRINYHIAKITANPYNVSLLSENIDRMLADMHVNAAAATRICLLGELLHRANIPWQESRIIVNAYKNHLKEA